LLATEGWQMRLAENISAGVMEYFSDVSA